MLNNLSFRIICLQYLKKNCKKRKITVSKQKAVANTADNTIKLWCLEKKNIPLRKLGTDQKKKK